MTECKRCKSFAINPDMHGRDNTDLDLCDVCYWRKRAEDLKCTNTCEWEYCKDDNKMRRHHYLKCETEYFQAVENGLKAFELRKNDRDYKVHDIVQFEEVVNGEKTGRKLEPREIVYIFHGGKYGLEEGYCIFQME